MSLRFYMKVIFSLRVRSMLVAMPESGVGTLPTPERNHIMY
jgi:hypothetical protein